MEKIYKTIFVAKVFSYFSQPVKKKQVKTEL